MYKAQDRIVFNGVGTYRWTARGRSAAGWWPAPETNTLIITTNYTGASAVFLLEPADGSYSTNLAPRFRMLTYGAGFAFTQVSVDGAAYVISGISTNMYVGEGEHSWTARGGVLPGPVYSYAPTTNVFTVVPEGADVVPVGVLMFGVVRDILRKINRSRCAPE
jgi:hypothetical protein